MRFLLFFLAGALLLQADDSKESRRAHKEEARYNHGLAKQAARDRKILEKQRVKQAKAAAKASHRR